jgi:hypothetical protein
MVLEFGSAAAGPVAVPKLTSAPRRVDGRAWPKERQLHGHLGPYRLPNIARGDSGHLVFAFEEWIAELIGQARDSGGSPEAHSPAIKAVHFRDAFGPVP